jgi:hypothetical protein
VAQDARLHGPALAALPAAGALQAGSAQLQGTGEPASIGSGQLQAETALVLTGNGLVHTPGHLVSQLCQLTGIGWSESTGIGILICSDSVLDGTDALFDPLLVLASTERIFALEAESVDQFMRATKRQFVFAARGDG